MADLVAEIAVSEAKFRQQTRKVFDDALKATADFERAANAKLADFGKGFSGSEMTKAQAREFDRLKKQIDPLYAASKRYETQLQQLNRAQQVGAINSRQYQAAVQQLNASMAPASEAAEQVGRTAGRMGSQLQNIGFQVGDFATQVGAGTSATQALGQQLPQLLGGFGAIGAVAGAAAAIMIPLGAALFKVAMDSETLKERMETLETATDAMADAADTASTPLSELTATYGDLADEIQRASVAAFAFSAEIARRNLTGTAASVSKDLFGGAFQVDRSSELQGQRSVDQMGLRFIKLADMIGASVDEAREFDKLLGSLGEAEGPADVVTAIEGILTMLAASPDAAKKFQTEISALTGLLDVAKRQMEALGSERQKLIDSYDKTTTELARYADDLKKAEAERAKAVAAGLKDEVSMWDRIIGKINEARVETIRAAAETDAAFKQMAASFPSFEEFKRGTSAEYQGAEYIARRTAGAGSQDEELVRATAAAAEQLGIATKDLLAIIMLESKGSPSIRGGAGNRHIGLIQFGAEEQRRYGANQNQTITEQMPAVVRYLLDRGVKPGMALPNIYAAVNAGQAHLTNRGDKRNGGIVDNIYDFTTGDQMKPYLGMAEGLLAAYPDVAKAAGDAAKGNKTFAETLEASARSLDTQSEAMGKSAEQAAYLAKRNELVSAAISAGVDPATKMAEIERQAQAAGTNARLAEEVKQRQKNAQAAKDYGATIEKNLVTAEQEAKLERERGLALQAVEASGVDGTAKAAAIAEINGEYEKQRIIFALIEDAKRRQVDLDTLMTGSTMTYAQAIAALGDAAKEAVVADQQRKATMDELAQRQAFYNDLQGQMKNGLIDAIVAGESFADVLANVAQMLAKAALQAALFGEGPFSGGGGGGLLSGMFGFLSGKRAMGGPVSAGGAYLVGERGPEIIVPKSAGTVIPNHRLGGGGGTMNININLAGANGDEAIARIAKASVMQGLSQYDRALPSRVQQVGAQPRRR